MFELMHYWDDDQPDWDAGAFVRALKAKLDGEIDVAGPELAGGLTALRVIDE
jgi:hypothetical protein